MRRLVNLLLVAVTATGPTACCCTAAGVSSAVLGRTRPVAAEAAKSPPRFCCPGHHRATGKVARGNANSQPVARPTERSDPSPGSRPCPCQERRASGAAVAGEVQSAPDLREYENPGIDPTGFGLAPATHLDPAAATRASRPRMPFLSAEERLRVHHVLRC